MWREIGRLRMVVVASHPYSPCSFLIPLRSSPTATAVASAMGQWNLTPSSLTAKSTNSLLLCQVCEFPCGSIKKVVRVRMKGFPVCLSASAGSQRRRRRVRVNAADVTPDGIDEDDESDEPSQGSSARSQLDLLEQLVSTSLSNDGTDISETVTRLTIREQLSRLVGDRGGELTVPLGKSLPASVKTLTTSQKRNIKRQAYLNEVSGRNDSVFFATVGAFVILPPFVILVAAVMTGYIDLSP